MGEADPIVVPCCDAVYLFGHHTHYLLITAMDTLALEKKANASRFCLVYLYHIHTRHLGRNKGGEEGRSFPFLGGAPSSD
jgi:hypothetical protein